MPVLVIPRRFHGPARSGNGGWTSGALARALHPEPRQTVQVRLNAPPPLERPLDVTVDRAPDGSALSAVLRDGTTEVAVARLVEPASPGGAPGPVDWQTASDAEPRYRGRQHHPFPGCFACGPDRDPADGLRLQPGPLPDQPDVTACRWLPDLGLDDGTGRVDGPVTWAALDCPGGWSVDLTGRPMVLGTMAARVAERPAAGVRHVVMGRVLRHEGRKAWTATALFALEPAPRLLASAEALWIAVDPASTDPASTDADR